jgi:hypothetical protein
MLLNIERETPNLGSGYVKLRDTTDPGQPVLCRIVRRTSPCWNRVFWTLATLCIFLLMVIGVIIHGWTS